MVCHMYVDKIWSWIKYGVGLHFEEAPLPHKSELSVNGQQNLLSVL